LNHVKGTTMKQSILFVLLLLISTNIQAAADAVAGKNKSAVCATCHGADGNSINPVWPSLAGQNQGYLAKQLKDYRDGNRKNMTMSSMAAALTDQDIADLAAYYTSLNAKAGTTKEKYVELGSKIYSGGVTGVLACTACHGPNGDGLDAAGFPKISGQKVQYVIMQLNNFKNGSRSSSANSMMNDIAAKMNDEQIEAIANYLAGLH
jgi:cytochrome c553